MNEQQKNLVYVLIAVALVVGAYIYVAHPITQTNVMTTSTSASITTIVVDKTAYGVGDTVGVAFGTGNTQVPVLSYLVSIKGSGGTSTNTIPATKYDSKTYYGGIQFKIAGTASYTITVRANFKDKTTATVTKVITAKIIWVS